MHILILFVFHTPFVFFSLIKLWAFSAKMFFFAVVAIFSIHMAKFAAWIRNIISLREKKSLLPTG
jgi:hypothetical protein